MSSSESSPAFEIKLNVTDFSPEELTVNTDDRYITIIGEHEEHSNDGQTYIARHFIRRFLLPENVDVGEIDTQLSRDGILTITAPSKDSSLQFGSKGAIQGLSDDDDQQPNSSSSEQIEQSRQPYGSQDN